jgi:hypothetical protein
MRYVIVLCLTLAGCGHELLEGPTVLPQLEAVFTAPSPLPTVEPVFLTPPTTQPAPPVWLSCENPEYQPPPFRLEAETQLTTTTLTVVRIKAVMARGSEIMGGVTEPPTSPWTPLVYTRGDVDRTISFRWRLTGVIGDGPLSCTTERTIDVVVPRS